MLAVYDGAVDKVSWMLRALVAVVLTVPLLVLTPLSAHAEAPTSLVDVTITENSSPVIDLSNPEQVVELSGTIINTSTARVRYTTVELWKSLTPITDGGELAETLDSPATFPVGERQLPSSEESGHVQVITREAWFDVGARASFTVRATVGELEFATDDAAYLVGVQVRGFPDGDGKKQVVGRGRILVSATSGPVRSSPVVALSAGPQRSPDGEFVDASLATALTSELADLLTVAEDTNATVLLDPMLLMDARALTREHTVAGETTPGLETATSWVSRVDALIRGRRVLRLPWGDIDLARARMGGHLDDVVQWSDDALTDKTLRSLPLAADLGSFASADLVKDLGGLGFTTVFAQNTSGGSRGPVQVVATSDISAPGMGPGGRNTAAQHVSRRVAGELLATTPPTYLARTPVEASAVTSLPVHRRFVGITSEDTPAVFTPADDVPAWDELWQHVDDLMADASFRRDLTGSDDLPELERLAASTMSSQFGTQAEALEWLASSRATVVDPSKITISATSQFVMGSRTNNFPVTITNGLDVPVRLRLVFDSESPQRIRVPATDFVTITPGENLTLIAAPEASSNSVVSVEVHMETMGGTRFGAPADIDITATELGRVAWIIIIISGAVVLGGTVWRIRAVQAERFKEDA